MDDGRKLRSRLLKEAKSLGFTLKRRGGFTVDFLRATIKALKEKREPKLNLIEIRDTLKAQGAPRKRIQIANQAIRDLVGAKKTRGTKERQVRHQKERRKRSRKE